MKKNDLDFMRIAIEVAQKARDKGNHPFGAILVDENGAILMEAENNVITDRDCTGHAETNLMRKASERFDADFLATCTLYTSTEPCPMCSSAIFWGNVGRVVYGLGHELFYGMIGEDSREALVLSCREVFSKGRKSIQIEGPVLEGEAIEVHKGFWS